MKFWTIPSTINNVDDIQLSLRRAIRLYYWYAIVLNFVIQYAIRVESEFLSYVGILIAVQAAQLFYVFQTYRRLFVLSPIIKNSILFRLSFFIWLLFMLLIGIEQMLHFPFVFGGMMFVITGNENFASVDSNAYFLFVNIFILLLGIAGELLLRKIYSKRQEI